MANIVAYPVEHGQRHVVLIVESDRGACRFLVTHLKHSGFHAASVTDSEKAQRLIELGVAFDIVVSDGNRTQGLHLARWIMDHAPSLPLILVLPNPCLPEERRCGAEIFAKPYAFEALAGKIRDTLQRNRPRSVIKPKGHGSGALLSFGRRIGR